MATKSVMVLYWWQSILSTGAPQKFNCQYENLKHRCTDDFNESDLMCGCDRWLYYHHHHCIVYYVLLSLAIPLILHHLVLATVRLPQQLSRCYGFLFWMFCNWYHLHTTKVQWSPELDGEKRLISWTVWLSRELTCFDLEYFTQ